MRSDVSNNPVWSERLAECVRLVKDADSYSARMITEDVFGQTLKAEAAKTRARDFVRDHGDELLRALQSESRDISAHCKLYGCQRVTQAAKREEPDWP